MKYIPILFTIILMYSCSCKKNLQSHDNPSKNDSPISIEKTEGPNVIYNSTKEFMLIIDKKNIRKNDPFPTIFFSVVSIKSKKLIYKDIVPGGKIEWVSDFELSVKSLIKRPKNIHSTTTNLLYRLNIKTLKRYK